MTTITIKSVKMSRRPYSSSSTDPPSYEMSTITPLPPGIADDGSSGYTDISAIPDDNSVPMGLYPEVIVTTDPNESFNSGNRLDVSAGSGDDLLKSPMRRTPRPGSRSSSRGMPAPAYAPGPGHATPIAAPYRAGPAADVWHTEQSTTVVVNQAPVVNPTLASRPGPRELIETDHPTPTTCFNCGNDIVTYNYMRAGACTYCACVALMLVGLDCGCCLIPFYVDTFKDVIHKCPRCHVILGKHKKGM